MSEKVTGYKFGTPDEIGATDDLIGLDEVELLISEQFYELDEDLVLLAGTQHYENDGYEGTIERVAPWTELGLPYSYEELLGSLAKLNKAVNAINRLGNSEEHRFPTYTQESAEVSWEALRGYPEGEALTGYGVPAFLGADLPKSIGERFGFYANHPINNEVE